MKFLYKYPQAEYPYADLVRTNAARNKLEKEYELLHLKPGHYPAVRHCSCSVRRACLPRSLRAAIRRELPPSALYAVCSRVLSRSSFQREFPTLLDELVEVPGLITPHRHSAQATENHQARQEVIDGIFGGMSPEQRESLL